MTVKLVKLNINTWHDALNLKVSDDHKNFVAPNVYSIAQVQFHPYAKACGIYDDDLLVGFAMYGFFFNDDEILDEGELPDKRFWISRIMIAEDQRGKGYSKAAMKLIIEEALSMNLKQIVLSTEPENLKAISLYRDMGFRPNGRIEDGEEEYIKIL